MTASPIFEHSRLANAQLWLIAACSYFVLASATIYLTSSGRDIATLWAGNAVLTALMVLCRRSQWGIVLSAGFVGNALANLITRGSLMAPLLFGLSNLIEVVVVAIALRNSGIEQGVLSSSKCATKFLIVAGLIAPSISGIAGAASAWALFDKEFGRAFFTWTLSDGLGLLIFMPVFTAVFRGDFLRWWTCADLGTRMEASLLLGGTAALTAVIFFVTNVPILFLLYPAVMLITFRLGPLGTKVAVMLIAVIGGLATMQGLGPVARFSSQSISQAHLFLAFLTVMLFTCLPVAAEVSARARVTRELALREEEMSRRAITDPLTGVLNRWGLEALATRTLNSEPSSMSLVAIDLDHFKTINDRWGHAAGDQALKHLASLLREVGWRGATVGRLGGDEFVLLLPDSNVAQAKAVCSQLSAKLRCLPFSPDGVAQLVIGMSCGVAASVPKESYESLLSRADRALYHAKASGRDVIKVAA